MRIKKVKIFEAEDIKELEDKINEWLLVSEEIISISIDAKRGLVEDSIVALVLYSIDGP